MLAEAAAAPGVCWPFVPATPTSAAPLAESAARKDEPAPAFPLPTVATDVLDAFVSVLALVPAAAAAVVVVVAIFFAGAAVGLGAAAEAVAVVTGARLGAAVVVVVVVVLSGVTLRKKFGSKGSPKRPMSRLSMGLILTCSFSRITAALGMRALSSHITPVLPLVHTHS